MLFQHTAARRRLDHFADGGIVKMLVSTHSRPKAAGKTIKDYNAITEVSTHSRPKAAGPAFSALASASSLFQHTAARRRLAGDVHQATLQAGFNTQPPEGGWTMYAKPKLLLIGFNTQPPEGGWRQQGNRKRVIACFNTQPPEGGWPIPTQCRQASLSFNTQPPEGGWRLRLPCYLGIRVSTHSRPKAAGLASAKHELT